MAFASVMASKHAGSIVTYRRRKKRLENWTDRDTLCLIDVWRDNNMALRCVKRNHHIYQKMTQQLLHRSPVARSTFEVRNKICNLTSLYRKEKLRMEREHDAPNWKFWNAVHEVMCAAADGVPPIDSSMLDGSLQSMDDSAAVTTAVDSSTSFHSHVEAILSTPAVTTELDTRFPASVASEMTFNPADSIDALLAASEIKREPAVDDDAPQGSSYEGSRWEPNVDRSPAYVPNRQPMSLQRRSSNSHMRKQKQKHRQEEQRLRIMRLMYEETRRMNSATRSADAEALALMREQLDLQRRSVEIEERIADAVERTCRDLSSAVRSGSISERASPPPVPSVVTAQCNGNSQSAAVAAAMMINGTMLHT